VRGARHVEPARRSTGVAASSRDLARTLADGPAAPPGELRRLALGVRARPVGDPVRATRALELLVHHTGGHPGRLWPLLDLHGGPAEALRAARSAARGKAEPGPPGARAEGEGTGGGAAATIPYWDARYPDGLWRLTDPPPLLFYAGDPALLARPSLAVVGTRRCSEHGRNAARAIALAAGARGFVVVSGHAQGIDAAAHEAAVEHGTIAVLGCGVDVAYPRVLTGLRSRILARGLVISEFGPGTPPLRHHFPRRNRLIAALSGAVVVVEAPHRSGAQNTVTHALDLGLDVGAVPGPIDRPSCAGSNRLLREGAAVICEPENALELVDQAAPPSVASCRAGATRSAAAGQPARPAPAASDPGLPRTAGVAAWDSLGDAGATVDDLAERTGRDPAELSSALLELEIAGVVVRLPGGRFARAKRI
jgi:DNA processing protein